MSIGVRGARTRSTLAVIVCCTAIAIIVACSSDSVTGPRDVPGTYVLRTINGSSLPYTAPNTVGNSVIVNSATASVDENGTYAVAGTGTINDSANTVLTDFGSWTQEGDRVHFTSTHLVGAFYFAVAKEDTVTVTLPGGFLNSTDDTFSLLFVKGS